MLLMYKKVMLLSGLAIAGYWTLWYLLLWMLPYGFWEAFVAIFGGLIGIFGTVFTIVVARVKMEVKQIIESKVNDILDWIDR